MQKPDLVGDAPQLDFHDTQSVTLPHPITAIEAWNRVMSNPLPFLRLAFAIRDAISSRFGVKRIGGFSGAQRSQPAPGDRLDFFLVERADRDCLTLTERDRHLDVMTCVTSNGSQVAITSSVITHNLFGKLYMVPVAPAHRLIVRLMLRRLRRGMIP
jgi:hypothetical protein